MYKKGICVDVARGPSLQNHTPLPAKIRAITSMTDIKIGTKADAKNTKIDAKKANTKRAQVTVFIIVGILLLLALILIIALRKEVISFTPGEVIPTEKGKVENFITLCLESAGEEALFRAGQQAGYVSVPTPISNDAAFHLRTSPFTVIPYWAVGPDTYIPSIMEIKQGIDDYIEEHVRECLLGTEAFQETYTLEEKSDLEADTQIVDDKVIFILRWNIEIRDSDGEVVSELINHVAESPIKLKQAYEMASRIVEKEMETLKLEDLTQDLIALEHPTVPVAGIELRCSRKTWHVDEVKEALRTLLRLNIRELRIKGTEFVEFPEELPYYQNHYIWDIGEEYENDNLNVQFRFDDTFPFTFAVTPSSGNVMESAQLGGNNILSLVCIQQWKFTYDIIYPVIVRARDETTGYNFNIAFTVHVVRNLPERGTVSARPSYLTGTVNDEEYCAQRRIPMTVSTWELVENDKTGVYAREPLAGVDTSFTCLQYHCEMPTTRFGSLSQYAASYTTNFPYCVGGILRGGKDGYKEAWGRVVTSPGKEIELDLVPLFILPAPKVRIVKHQWGEVPGPAQPLGRDDLALLTLTAHRDDDSPQEPFHQTRITKAGFAQGDAQPVEQLELLAKADFEYEVDIRLLHNEQLAGGYHGNWTIPWHLFENAEEVTFHVLSMERPTEEELFGMLLRLDQLSASVPGPEIK